MCMLYVEMTWAWFQLQQFSTEHEFSQSSIWSSNDLLVSPICSITIYTDENYIDDRERRSYSRDVVSSAFVYPCQVPDGNLNRFENLNSTEYSNIEPGAFEGWIMLMTIIWTRILRSSAQSVQTTTGVILAKCVTYGAHTPIKIALYIAQHWFNELCAALGAEFVLNCFLHSNDFETNFCMQAMHKVT